MKYTLSGGEKTYFVELSGIDAVDFDKKITVTYGGSEITLSVLDFCALALKKRQYRYANFGKNSDCI